MDMDIPKDDITVLGLDPPASTNMGWAIFSTKNTNGMGKMVDGGIFVLPDREKDRLLAIRDFIIDLIDKYNINSIVFERSIGRGFDVVRACISENTGVIKLVAASYDIQFEAIHTSTMALIFTGSGSFKGKKSRIKQIARDIFHPGMSYKSIASSPSGNECYEHIADSEGFCVTYLLKLGIPVEGPGGTIFPK
jgi:Holliday junction resolvasome RuvABC endonuclease subunit